jgi:hypothetical protein
LLDGKQINRALPAMLPAAQPPLGPIARLLLPPPRGAHRSPR